MRIRVLRGDGVVCCRGLRRDRHILLALRGRLQIVSFVLDNIEASSGNAVLGVFPGLSPLLLTQIPQGGTEFFARASGQLLQVQNREARQFTCRLAIEETKHRQPAILLAFDTVKKFPSPQAKPVRISGALPESFILCAFGPVGKSVVSLRHAQKSPGVAGDGIIRVKAACQGAVYTFNRFFIRLRPNSQNLVVIGKEEVSLTGDGGLNV